MPNRLLRDDMFSGCGWRTVAQEERVFNPLSYHLGSVWPHDNSIIADGMALNEMREGTLRILTSLYQTRLNFRDYRLPELFCGLQRREFDEPVHYPVGRALRGRRERCSSSWLRPCSQPSAPRKELNVINSRLPEWLDHLHIRNQHVGRSRVGLDFTHRGERTFCNVVDVEADKLARECSLQKVGMGAGSVEPTPAEWLGKGGRAVIEPPEPASM